MQNYNHKKLIDEISELDQPPSAPERFARWLEGTAHLDFLERNANADELIVFASGKHSFINTVVIPNDRLSPVDMRDLMQWNFNVHQPIASIVSSKDKTWIERGLVGTGSKTLDGGVQLIFARIFDSWDGPGRNYLELHQEYAHLSGIHWRPENRAFCRFNEHGDLENVVSLTTREDKSSDLALATFKREPLEEYLAAGNASLVRMFDIPLHQTPGFAGWSASPPEDFRSSKEFFGHRKIEGHASYLRGVQIIRAERSQVWGTEPARVFRRLQPLRGWSDEQVYEIFTGSPGTRGANGLRPRAGAPVAVVGDRLDCAEDRVYAGDATPLGAAS